MNGLLKRKADGYLLTIKEKQSVKRQTEVEWASSPYSLHYVTTGAPKVLQCTSLADPKLKCPDPEGILRDF